MSHAPALVAGRLGLPALCALLAVAHLGEALAAPIYSVGAKEVIYSAAQRRSLGLDFWPDGAMGAAAAGAGKIDFYAANSSSPVRTTGSLTNPGQSKQNVSITGLLGGYNYVAGGPVYQDAATGRRLMVYHAERHGSSAQDYYSMLGLAVSTDAAGLQFRDLGLIVQTNVSQQQKPHSIEVGGGSLAVVGDQIHVYYRDYLAAGGSSELAVARAPLATVLNNASYYQGTAFTKYYNGSWSQPGLGGLSSALETGNPGNTWSSVARNDYLNGLVMVSSQWESGGGDLYLSTSTDGVSWSPRQAVARDPGEQIYPSLLGVGPDPSRTGQSFYVYYTDSAAGGWNRWTDAQLARRQITFDPASTPAAPGTGAGEWALVSSFLGDFQEGTPAQGWRYLWNPTGKTGNAAAFATLKWSSVAGAYNTTGGVTPVWSGGNGHVDDYLTLATYGGHPGQPGFNAIASYTIQPDDGAGFYRLADTSINKVDAITSPNEDGLNLSVWVNNSLRSPTQTVSTSGAVLNFDRDLGQLAVGDTVYVMLGAGANQNMDSFRNFDFSILKSLSAVAPSDPAPPIVVTPVPPQAPINIITRGTVIKPPATSAPPANPTPPAGTPVATPVQPTQWIAVSDYINDFQTAAPAPGWKYLWSPSGKAGNAAAFAPLKWSNVAGAYNTTGAATPAWSGGKGHIDDYLTLGAGGGHPGQSNYFAIAAYTIQADDGAGVYRIAESSIMKADAVASPGEDGLQLMVFVNNTLTGSVLVVPTSGAAISFDRTLGQLAVGDSIYVLIGAGANQNYDSFKNFDFTIQRGVPVAQFAAVMAVPEPAAACLLAAAGFPAAARARRRRGASRSPSHETRHPRLRNTTTV